MNETATIPILPLTASYPFPNCRWDRGGRFARASASKKYKQLATQATVELGLSLSLGEMHG